MIFEYILKIELNDIFYYYFDDNRIKVSHFRKSINIDKNDIEVI